MTIKNFDLPSQEQDNVVSLVPDEDNVSISLEWWHSSSECISAWRQTDLERLRKLIDKVQKITPSAVRTDPGLEWKQHKGPAKGHGFSRPTGLPRDVTLCEMKVTSKARVHGFLVDSVFYLVWLDRNHAVFPHS